MTDRSREPSATLRRKSTRRKLGQGDGALSPSDGAACDPIFRSDAADLQSGAPGRNFGIPLMDDACARMSSASELKGKFKFLSARSADDEPQERFDNGQCVVRFSVTTWDVLATGFLNRASNVRMCKQPARSYALLVSKKFQALAVSSFKSRCD